MTTMPGMAGAVLANLLWGLSPLYYAHLGSISPMFLLCSQVILTFAVLAALQGLQRSDGTRSSILRTAPTAILIALNWSAYVAAVLHGKAIQASYAYFIAPILTVLMATAAFNERLPKRQLAGVLITCFAIMLDIALTREIPVLGILIALPFAAYIILHKKLGTDNPIRALKRETMILAPIAMLFVFFSDPGGVISQMPSSSLALLGLIGIVNALPLLLFIRAAPKLNAAQLGVCQFIAPVTSAILSQVAFGVEIGFAKLAILFLLTLGMGFTVMPRLRKA